jgi:hyperosmotically inducible periplasmic protein
MRTVLLVAVTLVTCAAPAPAHAATPQDLATRAAEAIRLAPQLSIFDDVETTTRDGVIRLTGCVTTERKRLEVGARVQQIAGTSIVANEIHVLPDSASDARLRAAAARAIYGHAMFRKYASMARPPIHIIVADGRVKLTGAVRNDAERALAFALAHVADAVAVSNNLRIE